MRSLADRIEAYIKQMLEVSEQGFVELQRSEIAQIFACVPSQINYVLSTRFSPEQGYLVESRRGGGGYLRIIKLDVDSKEWLSDLIAMVDNSFVSQQAGEGLVDRLLEEEFLTDREALLVKAIISREALPVPLPQRDLVRAHLLKAVLVTLMRDEFQ
ncbi:MAG: CtsR family transcriptional regulator [Clostridia bacterium]|nr:CtsR family transcriptional regulator [Clostridia bacterium]